MGQQKCMFLFKWNFIPIDVISTGTMDAWAAATLIYLGVTVRGLKTFRTLAVKSVLLVNTCSPISTGAGCTLVYFHITFGTWQEKFHTSVSIFFVKTQVFFIWYVMFSISESFTCKTRFANTVIAVDAVFADAIIAWVTCTVIKVNLTICAWGGIETLTMFFSQFELS